MPRLVADEKIPGLFLNPTSGIYYLKKTVKNKGRIYTSLKERDRKRAIGAMDEELSRWLMSREAGPERRINEIVKELLENYYRTRARTTYQNFRYITLKHIMPYFDGCPIKNVARGIPAYIAAQKSKDPTRKLAHDVKHLHRILNFAVERGYLEGFARFRQLDRQDRSPEPGREYSDTEIRKILDALDEKHREQAALILSTGMRPGEVRQLRFDYIDFKNGTVTLPAGVVKTRIGRTFPVSKKVLTKLAEKKLKAGGAYVFPSKFDANAAEIRSTKPWQRAEAKIGIKIRPHWLRHTYATRALRAGIQSTLISKYLGMSEEILKQIYLHPSLDDKKRMAAIVAQNLPDVL